MLKIPGNTLKLASTFLIAGRIILKLPVEFIEMDVSTFPLETKNV